MNGGGPKEEPARGFAQGPHTGHCGREDGEKRGGCLTGDKTECKLVEKGRFLSRRRAGVQIKSAMAVTLGHKAKGPWEYERSTEIRGERKGEAGSPPCEPG